MKLWVKTILAADTVVHGFTMVKAGTQVWWRVFKWYSDGALIAERNGTRIYFDAQSIAAREFITKQDFSFPTGMITKLELVNRPCWLLRMLGFASVTVTGNTPGEGPEKEAKS